jgi:glycerol-3-phosphate dehydrogenase
VAQYRFMKRDVEALASGEFDLVVVGGGIVGTWAAYDAALRGLKVALIEQDDWASGTSCASSKLIHGGLRYLERFEFGLVKTSLHERRRLARLGPHRVWPLRFGVPLYPESRVGPLRFGIGLNLYDWLAGKDQPVDGHDSFSPQAFSEHFPTVRSEGLRKSFTYGDCQTDDARMVLELVDGAQQAGAVTVHYAQVRAFRESADGQVSGLSVVDLLSQKVYDVRTRAVINASGVWSKENKGSATYRMTKGIHLLLPRLPEDEALLLMASDGRVFFVIPWYGRTLVGTTDTDYHGDPAKVAVDADDVEYLLESVNVMLDKAPWTADDVIGSYAGLRMLKHDPKAPPSAVSRGWSWKREANGVIASVGGKFTTAREDAGKLVNQITKAECKTHEQPFPWAPSGDFKTWQAAAVASATALGVDPETAKNLSHRYGTNIDQVLSLIEADAEQAKRIVPELAFCRAEEAYCRAHEMVVKDDDLWRRRIPLEILNGKAP